MMSATIIRTGIFEIQMCCSKDCDEDFILKQASEQDGGNWAIKELGSETYVQCADDQSRHHVVLSYVSSTLGSFA